MSSPSSSNQVFCLLFGSAHEDPVQRLAEACYRFTPQIAVRPGEAVFLDMEASLHLFREELLVLRLQALCRRFGLAMPRITRHRDASSALASARFGGEARIENLPLEALVDYASPFAELERSRSKPLLEACALLRGLGLVRLGDLAQLPRESLASRFGEEGLRIVRWVQEGSELPWPSFRLPEVVVERLDLYACDTMAPCSELEPLLFAARTVIDRAMARLRARLERAATIRLVFELESKIQDRAWEIEFPLPQGATSGVLPILRDRLHFDLQRTPLDSPVTSIVFEVQETAPGRGAQRDFFNRTEEEAEAWEALVGRLERRGHHQKTASVRTFVAVQVDRHLPEKNWRPAEWDSRPGPPRGGESTSPALSSLEAIRQSRLLKQPERLNLSKDGWLVGRRHRWLAREWHGPERLSGEWWESGFSRDYYRVVTDQGLQLWVFFAPTEPPELRLHGYFD